MLWLYGQINKSEKLTPHYNNLQVWDCSHENHNISVSAVSSIIKSTANILQTLDPLPVQNAVLFVHYEHVLLSLKRLLIFQLDTSNGVVQRPSLCIDD